MQQVSYRINKLMNIFKKKDWIYMNKIVNPPRYEYDCDYYTYRLCKNTGIFQYQDVHCLGYNPPTYISTWYTVHSKPKLKKNINNEWEVV